MCFAILLSTQHSKKGSSVSLSPQRPSGTVLVVDDDDRIRKLVTTALRRAGYEIAVAASGKEAIERLAEATPDLIVSDVMMPELDGFGLLTYLRADPTLRTIPVIMLTAKGTTDDVVHGLDLGADDYLAKPFDMSELLARVRAKIERPPVPSELLPVDRQTGLLSERLLWPEVEREVGRAGRGGRSGSLAYLSVDELPRLRERLGPRAEAQIARQMTGIVQATARPLDIAGRDAVGNFVLLLPETDADLAMQRLRDLAQVIVTTTFSASTERVRLTPTIGFAPFTRAMSVDTLRDHAHTAMTYAAVHLDLQPQRYDPSMDAVVAQKKAEERAARQARLWERTRERFRLPFQIGLTLLISIVIPFVIYALLATYWVDITRGMYLLVVAALLVTGYLILLEGQNALRVIDPPEEPGSPYPPATAIIAAYLPNEAATVVETVEAFLRLDYPGPLQVILAYNTPRDMPIEATLKELAERDRRFFPYRVLGSTSKAQNVNAALAEAIGEFIGVFDADHHPQADSFLRAWRWLSTGYDVVQGHCVVRNGEDSWVARLVAVEFEAIYAVAHPGRARLHGFGIFGGSNGYWQADLLRQTRMHGFMLTEDIDSALRVVEAGYKIASDPHLISRELGPVTLKALWNQRMRWAQGWVQVSLKHILRALRSPHLSLRQKLGFVHLLGWRELYPWLSVQMFPIIAFWLWYYGAERINWLVPIFVLTTLFTFSVGPIQTLFAYLLAVPDIRRHRDWFLFYFVVTSLFYTEYKNIIAHVAVIKEAMRERAWKVTPRTTAKETPEQRAGT